MKVQWLGTAAAEGWPALFCECEFCARARELGGRNIRTRSSIMVNDRYKIDLPPDTYHHVLTQGLNLAAVEFLLITHSHSDHLNASELEMRHPPFAHTQRPLSVYGNEAVARAIDARVGASHRAFSFEVVEPFRWYSAGAARFMPLTADHDRSQQCLFYLLEVQGTAVLVGNDTGYFPDESWEALERARDEGVKVVVVSLDTTNGPLPGRQNHMGFDCICEVRQRLLDTGCADGSTSFVATHFSHNGGLMHAEMEAVLGPRGFAVAYDGMVLQWDGLSGGSWEVPPCAATM